MSISREEAASALSQIDLTTERSREMKGYRIAGPILVAWGVIWAVGYCGMGVMPVRQWGWMWLVLDVLGVALQLIILRQYGGVRRRSWKPAAAAVAIIAFEAATEHFFHASSSAPYMIYPGMVIGFAYIMIGLWRMPRMAWIGAAMFAASFAGIYLIPHGLNYWMAAVGGIGLFLGGLWLRKA
ncbi:MAG TPA: hypothetical protein VG960_08930 [Caulobacteraceae bacterium]|nr:hypothetical protein [Caulobacteraceae bacterium]